MGDQNIAQKIARGRLNARKAIGLGATGVILGLPLIIIDAVAVDENNPLTILGGLFGCPGITLLIGGLIFYFFVYGEPSK